MKEPLQTLLLLLCDLCGDRPGLHHGPGPACGANSVMQRGKIRIRCGGGGGRVWESFGADLGEPVFAQRQTAGVAKSGGRGCEHVCVLSAQESGDLWGRLLSSSQGRFLWMN